MADGTSEHQFSPRIRPLSGEERDRIMRQYGVQSVPDVAAVHDITDRLYDAARPGGIKIRDARRNRAIARRQKFERAASRKDAIRAEARQARQAADLERYSRVAAMCRRNMTANEIATELQISPSGARNYCRKHGLEYRRIPQDERDQKRPKKAKPKKAKLDRVVSVPRLSAKHLRIIELANTGEYTIAQIAAEVGETYDMAHRFLYRRALSNRAKPSDHNRDTAPGLSEKDMKRVAEECLASHGWTWAHAREKRFQWLGARADCMAAQRAAGATYTQLQEFWGIVTRRAVKAALQRARKRDG